jgi:hypothetical protein
MSVLKTKKSIGPSFKEESVTEMFGPGDRVLWTAPKIDLSIPNTLGVIVEAIPSQKGFEHTMYRVQFNTGVRMVFEEELKAATAHEKARDLSTPWWKD